MQESETKIKIEKDKFIVESLSKQQIPKVNQVEKGQAVMKFKDKGDFWMQSVKTIQTLTPQEFLQQATSIRGRRDQFLKAKEEYERFDENWKEYEKLIKKAREIIDKQSKEPPKPKVGEISTEDK